MLQPFRSPDNPDSRAAAANIGLKHYRKTLLCSKGTRLRQSSCQTVSLPKQNERWNGSGSPEGLEGEAITPLARVLGIAKELDSQLYGQELGEEPRPVKSSLVQLRDMADKQFDAETVNALLIAYRNGRRFDTTQDSFKNQDSDS